MIEDLLLQSVPVVHGFKVLEPCVLIQKLGEGGMGAVYLGRHLHLHMDAAVKCLKTAELGHDKESIDRFQQEARIAAQINSPHLIRVYQLSEGFGLHYFVMEYVEGETAEGLVKRRGGPIALTEACSIALDATLGLADAHKRHVIHRDIKPSNILISTEGEVKVTDLGIAKAVSGGENVTRTAALMGTPQYMPPELFDGAALADERSDIYAMGATVAFMVIGNHAVGGDTVQQIMKRVCVDGFPDAATLRADLPKVVVELIRKATASDPDARHQTAKEMIDALRTCLDDPQVKKNDEQTAAKAKDSGGDIPKTIVMGGGRTIPATIAPRAAGGAARPNDQILNTIRDTIKEQPAKQSHVIVDQQQPVAPPPPRRSGLLAAAILLLAVGVAAAIYLAINPPGGGNGVTNGANNDNNNGGGGTKDHNVTPVVVADPIELARQAELAANSGDWHTAASKLREVKEADAELATRSAHTLVTTLLLRPMLSALDEAGVDVTAIRMRGAAARQQLEAFERDLGIAEAGVLVLIDDVLTAARAEPRRWQAIVTHLMQLADRTETEARDAAAAIADSLLGSVRKAVSAGDPLPDGITLEALTKLSGVGSTVAASLADASIINQIEKAALAGQWAAAAAALVQFAQRDKDSARDLADKVLSTLVAQVRGGAAIPPQVAPGDLTALERIGSQAAQTLLAAGAIRTAAAAAQWDQARTGLDALTQVDAALAVALRKEIASLIQAGMLKAADELDFARARSLLAEFERFDNARSDDAARRLFDHVVKSVNSAAAAKTWGAAVRGLAAALEIAADHPSMQQRAEMIAHDALMKLRGEAGDPRKRDAAAFEIVNGVSRDDLKPLADKGVIAAMLLIAESLIWYGEDDRINADGAALQQALDWAQRAAAVERLDGSAVACLYAGDLHLMKTKDNAKAIEFYKAGVKRNNPHCMSRLALRYFVFVTQHERNPQMNVDPDAPDKVIRNAKELADAQAAAATKGANLAIAGNKHREDGNAIDRCAYTFAIYSYYGVGMPQDIAQAKQILSELSIAGYGPAASTYQQMLQKDKKDGADL